MALAATRLSLKIEVSLVEVNLTADIERVIEQKLAAREYPSLDALLEEALFLLVERDWQLAQSDLRQQASFLWDEPESGPSEEAAP